MDNTEYNAPMVYDLHGLILRFATNDALIGERIVATFGSRPRVESSGGKGDIHFGLELCQAIPPPPDAEPDYAERDLIHYYIQYPLIVAQLPRYGQLRIDLTHGTIEGEILAAAITTYGVFEDLVAIGLSPLLRRRGKFFIHAFAAAYKGRAALLVGDIGAGKTTTGIALLRAGWKLVSNDSPLLGAATTRVWSYPGLLSGYAETLRRFPELHALVPTSTEHVKVTFAAESIYPDVWCESAAPGVILFPSVQNISQHQVEKLSAPQALGMLLPHAVERWDTEMIPQHLALLNQLCAQTPAYMLLLANDTNTIPQVIGEVLGTNR